MSSRALRRLREEKAAVAAAAALETIRQEDDNDDDDEGSSSSSSNRSKKDDNDSNDEDDEDEDDDDEEYDSNDEKDAAPKKSVFLLMNDSSEEEEDEEEDDDKDEDETGTRNDAAAAGAVSHVSVDKEEGNGRQNGKNGVSKKSQNKDDDVQEEEEEEEEQDVDALLLEFQAKDWELRSQGAKAEASSSSSSSSWKRLLLGRVDPRNYDLDASLRATLGAGGEPPPRQPLRRGGGVGSKGTTFGRPKPEWGRPPSLIGGGLGMQVVAHGHDGDDDKSPPPVPWPYHTKTSAADEKKKKKKEEEEEEEHETENNNNNKEETPNDSSNKDKKDKISSEDDDCTHFYRDAVWYSFTRSETYQHEAHVLEELVATGNANALALHVADHPYHAEATLQLAMMLFLTNQREHGLELLKRALWIYDCACVSALLPTTGAATAALLNFDHAANQGYFSALFRLVQVSGMMGCVATSLAVGRYLLSLDPLRDPMGILLVLDYFALATMSNENAQWILHLVASPVVRILHRIHDDEGDHDEWYSCALHEMPNWAFSVALACFRLEQQQQQGTLPPDPDAANVTANERLQRALQKFPMVLPPLLEKINKVDSGGRSFAMDWPPLVEHFQKAAAQANPSRAVERIVTLFVQRQSGLWSSHVILQWLHDNAAAVVATTTTTTPKPTYSPALLRYWRLDPTEYQDSFRTLPADANPLNAALVAPALAALDGGRQGRGRWLRRMPPPPPAAAQRGEGFPDDDMVVMDPDLPLVELFWRSMLPWVRVRGVRPQGRR